MLGCVVTGVVSDRLGRRSLVLVVCLVLASVLLALLALPIHNAPLMALLLFANGALINGPATLISGAISADLGTHPSLSSKDAMATVAGIIDGTGSFGAAIGQLAAGAISQAFGWKVAFIFLGVLCIVATLCIRPLLTTDRLLSATAASKTNCSYELVESVSPSVSDMRPGPSNIVD